MKGWWYDWLNGFNSEEIGRVRVAEKQASLTRPLQMLAPALLADKQKSVPTVRGVAMNGAIPKSCVKLAAEPARFELGNCPPEAELYVSPLFSSEKVDNVSTFYLKNFTMCLLFKSSS